MNRRQLFKTLAGVVTGAVAASAAMPLASGGYVPFVEGFFANGVTTPIEYRRMVALVTVSEELLRDSTIDVQQHLAAAMSGQLDREFLEDE